MFLAGKWRCNRHCRSSSSSCQSRYKRSSRSSCRLLWCCCWQWCCRRSIVRLFVISEFWKYEGAGQELTDCIQDQSTCRCRWPHPTTVGETSGCIVTSQVKGVRRCQCTSSRAGSVTPNVFIVVSDSLNGCSRSEGSKAGNCHQKGNIKMHDCQVRPAKGWKAGSASGPLFPNEGTGAESGGWSVLGGRCLKKCRN